MSEKHREPEVPEEEVPVAECLDGHAKHLPKYLIYKSESGCRFGEKCSYAHRQVDEQPSERSKKKGDKSAVAVLKKDEQHDRTGIPVRCVRLIKYTTIGLRIPGYGAAEVFIDFTEEFRHALTDPMCKIHESYCASH